MDIGKRLIDSNNHLGFTTQNNRVARLGMQDIDVDRLVIPRESVMSSMIRDIQSTRINIDGDSIVLNGQMTLSERLTDISNTINTNVQRQELDYRLRQIDDIYNSRIRQLEERIDYLQNILNSQQSR